AQPEGTAAASARARTAAQGGGDGASSAAAAARPTVAAEPELATAPESRSGAPAVGVVLGAGWEAVPRAPPHDSAAPAAPTPTDRNPESREASTGRLAPCVILYHAA